MKYVNLRDFGQRINEIVMVFILSVTRWVCFDIMRRYVSRKRVLLVLFGFAFVHFLVFHFCFILFGCLVHCYVCFMFGSWVHCVCSIFIEVISKVEEVTSFVKHKCVQICRNEWQQFITYIKQAGTGKHVCTTSTIPTWNETSEKKKWKGFVFMFIVFFTLVTGFNIDSFAGL